MQAGQAADRAAATAERAVSLARRLAAADPGNTSAAATSVPYLKRSRDSNFAEKLVEWSPVPQPAEASCYPLLCKLVVG